MLFSSIRSLLSESSLFEFPLLRKSKGYTLGSGMTPTRSEKKKKWKHASRLIPPQNYSTGLSAPFKFQAKLASMPQRTRQCS